MPDYRVGLKGLTTTLPDDPPTPQNDSPSAYKEDVAFSELPFLGSTPRSNIPANLVQFILDCVVSTGVAMIICSIGLYTWSAYREREYQAIEIIVNSKIIEKMPSSDTTQILGASEILYCLAEKKRLESQRKSVWGSRFWNSSYKDSLQNIGLRCEGKKYFRKGMEAAEQVYKENVELYKRQGELR